MKRLNKTESLVFAHFMCPLFLKASFINFIGMAKISVKSFLNML